MFVITGGGSGIGRALALALARRNQAVLIVGRREHALRKTAEKSSLIRRCVADIATTAGRANLVEHVQQQKNIQGLINNAGSIQPVSSITDIHPADWQQTMAVNLDAPMFLTQDLYSRLQGGRVLNIGSGAACFPVGGWAAYCVSKAALAMLTKAWQLESQQVAFASVMPGIIDTDMQTFIRHASGMDNDKKNFFIRLKEKNRLISPDAVAVFLSWLLLDIDEKTYSSREWDIYDTSHHHDWLHPPLNIPALEE